MSGVADASHEFQVLVVDDGIDGKVALHAVRVAGGGNLLQVVHGEGVGGVCPHVKVLDAEVDGIGFCLYGGGKGLARAHRCHNLEVVYGIGCHDVGSQFGYRVQR